MKTKHGIFKEKKKNMYMNDRSDYGVGATSTNVPSLKASSLVADRIAKAKKPFNLHATKDTNCEIF